MTSKHLKVACLSDVHLGHPNTPTKTIIENLEKAFPNNNTLEEIDILFIAGDFFDRLLHLPDDNAIEIRLYIAQLLRLCVKYKIILRVLEGTPSHDWRQSKLFTHINTMAKIHADVAYFDQLGIETIEALGIDVVYIPDEWRSDPQDTYEDVVALMRKHHKRQVDFIIMHGAFNYQLPIQVQHHTHQPEHYLPLVKQLIFIGHIHRHSHTQRIIAPGSFDRLAHGEEEPKGYVRATINQDTYDYTVTFHENPTAVTYQTLECASLNVDETLELIEHTVKPLTQPGRFRIRVQKDDAIFKGVEFLKKLYPMHQFTVIVDKGSSSSHKSVIDLEDRFEPITITSHNIEPMVMEYLKKEALCPTLIQKIRDTLNASL